MTCNTEGICVQIGLHQRAEYLYLTGAIPLRDNIKKIPDDIKFMAWKYYGIDCDPSSIHYMLEQYYQIDNTEWVVGHINPHKFDIVNIRSGFIGDYYYVWGYDDGTQKSRYNVPSMTLNMLFDSLDIDRVNVLSMDIEGDELDVFRYYDWAIQPEFIAVESHYGTDSELIGIICDAEYECTLRCKTNGVDTTELQFRRK